MLPILADSSLIVVLVNILKPNFNTHIWVYYHLRSVHAKKKVLYF